MYTLDPNKPIIMHKNEVLKPIKNEKKQIYEGVVQMEQTPNKFKGLIVKDNVTNSLYVENLDTNTELKSNEYRVDYREGRLYFHESKDKQWVKFDYDGEGYTLISDSRVYTRLDQEGNLVETLENVLEKGKEGIVYVEKLKVEVSKGTDINNQLKASIVIGNKSKVDLDESIVIGNKSKVDLDESIVNSIAKDTILKDTIVKAEEKKKDLDDLVGFKVSDYVSKAELTDSTLTDIAINNIENNLPNAVDGIIDMQSIKGDTLQNLCDGNFVSKSGEQQVTVSKNKIIFNKTDSPTANYRALGLIPQGKVNTEYTLVCNVSGMDGITNKLVFDGYSNAGYGTGISKMSFYIKNGYNAIKFTSKSKFEFTPMLFFNLESSPVLTKNVVIENIILLEGDYTSNPPNYFEGIKSTSEAEANKIEILSHGKNLIDVSKIIEVVNNKTLCDYIELDGKKCLFLKGDSVYNGKVIASGFKQDTQYLLKHDYKYADKIGGVIRFKYADGTTSGGNPTDSWETFYQISAKNKTVESITIEANSNGVTYFDSKKIMVIEAVNDTEYVPYQSDKIAIQLKEPLKGMANGAKDEIDVTNGKIIERIGKELLVDNSNWIEYLGFEDRDRYYVAYKANLLSKIGSNCICNNFSSVPESWANAGEGISFHPKTPSLYIKILKTKLSTPDLAGFKKWLSQNPTEIIYELETPIVTDLKIPTLKSFKDGSIQLNNTIRPIVNLKYATNVSGRLSTIEGAVDSNVDDTRKLEEALFTTVAQTIDNKDKITVLTNANVVDKKSIADNKIDADKTKTEVENARDGEANLATNIKKIKSQLAEKVTFHASKFISKLQNGESAIIVFLGDSTTEQNVTTGSNPNHVGQLTAWLQDLYPNLVTVINAGISGNTTSQMWNRLYKDVLIHNPDLIVICSGINDYGGTLSLTIDEYRKNYNMMVKEILAYKECDIIIRTPNPLISGAFNTGMEDFIKVSKGVAKRYNLGFFDFYTQMKTDIANGKFIHMDYMNDGTHPNYLGHVYMAELFKKYFIPTDFVEKPINNLKMLSGSVALRTGGTGGAFSSNPNYMNNSVFFFNIPNKFITIEFTGDEFAVVYSTAPSGGQFIVNIDGVNKEIIDTYAPSNNYRKAVAYKISSGKHLVKIINQPTKNPLSSATNINIQGVIYKMDSNINTEIANVFEYAQLLQTVTTALSGNTPFLYNSVVNLSNILTFVADTGVMTMQKAGLYDFIFSSKIITEEDKSIILTATKNSDTYKQFYDYTPSSVGKKTVTKELIFTVEVAVGDTFQFFTNVGGIAPTANQILVIKRLPTD